jgi:hypothetical protein
LVPAVPVARIGASQPERHRWTEQSPVARLAAGAQEKYSGSRPESETGV